MSLPNSNYPGRAEVEDPDGKGLSKPRNKRNVTRERVVKLETRPRSLGLATRSMRKKSVRVPNAYHMDGLERSGLGHEQRQLGADPTASRSLPTNVKMETSSSRFPRAKNVVSVPESNVLDNEEVQTAEEVEGFTVSKPNSGASAGNSDSNRDLAGTTRGVRNETRPGISLYPPGDSYRDHLASEAEESSMPAFDSEHAALHPGLPQEPNDIDLEGITNDSAPVVGNSMPRGISQLQRRNDLSPTCGKVDLHAIKLEACRRAARAGLDPCPEDEGPRKKPRFNVLRHILRVHSCCMPHEPDFEGLSALLALPLHPDVPDKSNQAACREAICKAEAMVKAARD